MAAGPAPRCIGRRSGRRLPSATAWLPLELPGIAAPGHRLATYGVYGLWLDTLLDALGIDAAWAVGNSFGATVAWRFAAQVSILPQMAGDGQWRSGAGTWFTIEVKDDEHLLRRFAQGHLRMNRRSASSAVATASRRRWYPGESRPRHHLSQALAARPCSPVDRQAMSW